MVIKTCKKHGELNKDQCYVQRNGKDKPLAYRCILCRVEKRLDNKFQCKTHGSLLSKDIGSTGKCLICRREKETPRRNYKDEYERKKNKYGKLHSLHKVCTKHGITVEQYYEIVKSQNNRCAICYNKETRLDGVSKKVGRLVIDHCHETNKVRGLLCHLCNTAIGKFKDDPIRMYRAIRYLKLGGFNKNG